MTKREAMARFGRKRPNSVIHFASISTKRPVWWLDIPTSTVEEARYSSVIFLLHDDPQKKLHVLEIPSEYLQKNVRHLYKRPDKEMYSFHLSSEGRDKFHGLLPSDSGLKFGQFVTESLVV